LDFKPPSVTKQSGKPWPKEMKRAAIELWNSKVPLPTISEQLKVSKRTLSMILAWEKTKILRAHDRQREEQ